MFNFLKKKRKANESFLNLPLSVILDRDSPPLGEIWHNAVGGQNKAVDYYKEFKRFETILVQKYQGIDFDKVAYIMDNIDITVGQCMYLYCLDLKVEHHKDSQNEFPFELYIVKDEKSTPIHIEEAEYDKIISSLSEEEKRYCVDVEDYINNNIYPLVNNTFRNFYGIDVFKSNIPINTIELLKYHQFLAGDYYDEKCKKYVRVRQSPVLDGVNSIRKDNPIVLVNLNKFLSCIVLDYLCYSSVAIPSMNMEKVLKYKSEETNEVVQDVIIKTKGQEYFDYIIKSIDRINCAQFRETVARGIKIE